MRGSMKATTRRIAGTLIVALLMLSLPGLALGQGPAECASEYVVEAGDWLSKIAQAQYGDASLYPAIVLATNARAATDDSYTHIADPWLIEPGWKLCIPTVEAAQSGFTVEALRNAEYQSEWTASHLAPLADGVYTEAIAPDSATKIQVLLGDRMAFGPLGDGQDAAAVLTITDPGGSGTFHTLAVVVEQNEALVNVATTSLGDRVKIDSLAIREGEIVVDMVTQGPNDPFCCPTQRVVQTYALQGQELVQTTSQIMAGAAAGGSLVDIVWTWTRFDDTSGQNSIVVPDPAKYTLTLRADGNYQVVADCNLSAGAYTLQDGSLTLAGGPTTLAECEAGSLYDVYLARLGEVASFVLDGDQLVLNLWTDGGNMVFVRSAAGGSIVDIVWNWTRFDDTSGQKNIVVPDPAKYTLTLRADGNYQVVADCNLSAGAYTLQGNSLTLTGGPTTLAECEPGSLYDVYLARLSEVATFVLDGDQLVLNLADGGNMVFVRSAG